MKTVTATHLREDLFGIIMEILKTHEGYCIHSRKGDIVMMPRNDYENLMETLELLSIPGLKQSIKEAEQDIEQGNVFTIDEVFEDE